MGLRRLLRAMAAIAAMPATACAWPAAAEARLALVEIGRFEQPTYLTAPRGDRTRLFIVERAGRILVMRRGRLLRRPFLDIRRLVRTDGGNGLHSIAFAPDYRRSGRFFVYFTGRATGDVRVEQFRRSRRNRNRAARRSRRLVIRVRHRLFQSHKGGQLQFGRDRLLYLATGDGGSTAAGDPFRAPQNLRSLLGKLIRIDPRRGRRRGYRIPRGNPFRGRDGRRDEIFAYGLRHPYRFSFDRRTGDLVLPDVGQDEVEEVNFLRRRRGRRSVRGGANFGWSVFEGSRRFRSGAAPGHVLPVLERFHPEYCSITGGYVVRDPRLAGLRGRYLYGDFCNPQLRSARLRRPRAADDRATGLAMEQVSSFGEDGRGRVYAISVSGPVSRLVWR